MLNHICVLFPATFLNDQFQLVGVLLEVSLNLTVSGADPDVILVVKEAIGGGGVTVIYPIFCVLL